MVATAVVVISIIAALVSIPAGIYYLWDRQRGKVPSHISWSKVVAGVEKTIRRLHSDNYIPDLVLAIGRSGAIYGGIIAGNMGNLPMALLDRHLVWDRKTREYVASHTSQIHLPEDCRKILVVVGEVYSGQSLSVSLERMAAELAGRDVRTACLVRSRNSNVEVDYVVYEVERAVQPAWILGQDYKRFELLPHRDREVSKGENGVKQREATTD